MSPSCLGIDASNAREGGGVTYLARILEVADPAAYGFDRVVVWGGARLLNQLPIRPWLEPAYVRDLDGALASRTLWQYRSLAALARRCSLLFVPGGSYLGPFRPFVATSQNLIPFDAEAKALYGLSKGRVRNEILRRVQGATFRNAAGLIFLTRAARSAVERELGPLRCLSTVVPHGVDDAYRSSPRPAEPITAYSADRPFRLLYVSTVDLYKHQWVVAEAVASLRARGWPVELHLIGSAYPPALGKLIAVLRRVDPAERFLKYHGPVAQTDLPSWYRQADGFVFASSCETFGIVLGDAMGAGLPIAAADRPSTHEVAGDGAVYFDPLSPVAAARALERLLVAPDLRATLAAAAYTRAAQYSWPRTSAATFGFFQQCVRSV